MNRDTLAEKLTNWYMIALSDIEQGQRLAEHNHYADTMITALDKLMVEASELDLSPLLDLRNQMFYLKYQIAERT